MKNIHQYKNKNYVNSVFDDVHQNYDLMNDIMSFGTHRLWKQDFVNSIEFRSKNKIIDMASGTGDISKLILKKNSHQNIYRIEPNFNMINNNIQKFKKYKNVKNICSYAEKYPFERQFCFDTYIISFGLRILHILIMH